MSTFGSTIFGAGFGGAGITTYDYAGTYNGWSFGPGTNSQILEITGLEDLPDMAPIDTQRLRDHGEFSTQDIASGRTITMKMLLLPGGGLDLGTLVEQFKAATVPQAAPLEFTFQLPSGRSRLIYCRPRRRAVPINIDYSVGFVTVDVEFRANDPRLYDTTLNTVTATAPTGGLGLPMPLTFPLSFGGAVSGGTAVLTNAGNFATRPVLTITGPCTNPYVSGPGGEILAFNIVLGAPDTLVVDFSKRSVFLNGTASRYSSLAQPFQWWEIPPGSSTVTFGAFVSGGCTATWQFRSAWV